MLSEQTVTPAAPTSADWLERARSLAPVIDAYRDESERQRRMARPIFDALIRTGIVEMLVSRAFGGPQVSISTFTRVVEEISRFDGSIGWNVMIAGGLVLFADCLDEDVADRIVHAGQGTVLAGSGNGTAEARPVPGGYEVTGRWSFASGCQDATWIFGGCIVVDQGHQARFDDNGVPERLGICVPAADCKIIDTWHTAGLRGTGSNDFRLEHVFVPEERTFPEARLLAGPVDRPSTMSRTPYLVIATPTIAAVALGIARDAIEAFKALALHKTPGFSSLPLAQHHTVQQQLGKAEALLRSARAYLHSTLDEITCAHAAGAPVTSDDSAALRLGAAHSAACAVEAVDLMFDAAGGSSVYQTSRLERCFRDAHMITHHLGVGARNFELVGQYLLGGPLQLGR
jgi:indole-3-acetate monooxygenase